MSKRAMVLAVLIALAVCFPLQAGTLPQARLDLSMDESFSQATIGKTVSRAVGEAIGILFGWRVEFSEDAGETFEVRLTGLTMYDLSLASCAVTMRYGRNELSRTIVFTDVDDRTVRQAVVGQLQYDVGPLFETSRSEVIDYVHQRTLSALYAQGVPQEGLFVEVLDNASEVVGLLGTALVHQPYDGQPQTVVEFHRLWGKRQFVPGMPLRTRVSRWQGEVALQATLERIGLQARFKKTLPVYPFSLSLWLGGSLPFTGALGFDAVTGVEIEASVPVSSLTGNQAGLFANSTVSMAASAGAGLALLADLSWSALYGAEVHFSFRHRLSSRLHWAVGLGFGQWVSTDGTSFVAYNPSWKGLKLTASVGFDW